MNRRTRTLLEILRAAVEPLTTLWTYLVGLPATIALVAWATGGTTTVPQADGSVWSAPRAPRSGHRHRYVRGTTPLRFTWDAIWFARLAEKSGSTRFAAGLTAA